MSADSVKVTRDNALKLFQVFEEDPSLREVELNTDERGALRVYVPVVTLRQISLSPNRRNANRKYERVAS